MVITYTSRTIEQSQPTRRSKTFIFACKAGEIDKKLGWITEWHGNKTIAELVEER